MGVSIQIESDIAGIEYEAAGLKKFIRSVCRRFTITDAEINVLITGDEQIRKLNKQFLKTGANTDCLSFDLSKADSGGARLYNFVVNAQEAERQAKKRGHSVQAELALYILHCMLHNLGFDDADREQASQMHKIEDEILEQHGFGAVYDKPAE